MEHAWKDGHLNQQYTCLNFEKKLSATLEYLFAQFKKTKCPLKMIHILAAHNHYLLRKQSFGVITKPIVTVSHFIWMFRNIYEIEFDGNNLVTGSQVCGFCIITMDHLTYHSP